MEDDIIADFDIPNSPFNFEDDFLSDNDADQVQVENNNVICDYLQQEVFIKDEENIAHDPSTIAEQCNSALNHIVYSSSSTTMNAAERDVQLLQSAYAMFIPALKTEFNLTERVVNGTPVNVGVNIKSEP